MPDDLRISSASYDDLPEVARIHVTAWKQAYAGQVPQFCLDNLDVGERLRRWQLPMTVNRAQASRLPAILLDRSFRRIAAIE